MGMQAGMDRAASWGEAVWRVWEDAPEPVRYGALCIIAIYAIWLVLFFTQRRILYFTDPTRIHPSDCELDRTEETELGTPDGHTLIVWRADAKDDALPHILYLHGNRRALWRRARFFRLFIASGWGLSALAHRGFNGSTGRPSEPANVADAILAFDALVAEGIRPGRIVVYGESLGSGTAVQLAAARPVGGLILHAPYDSFRDIVRSRTAWLLPRAIFRERYDSIRQIGQVKAPVLWLHGDKDRIIPQGRGRRLYDAALSTKYAALVKGANHFGIYTQAVFNQHVRFFAEACASLNGQGRPGPEMSVIDPVLPKEDAHPELSKGRVPLAGKRR
ncbi:MAG: alpha/beta hydrolase [Oceanicaulis sp.]|uniref:alpha/beta hydrolase n=1 Tax=unclassified Oceanicaulis TaxID=2632123 RepID=UPI0009FEBE04|nr:MULTISPECIES: alpha/beta hydrolase [unclassified Oceanicaulis]MBC39117.1 alpha/beta hydrolase [Oceanicaulis sp.]MBG35243.1 alpha/beta hydrolase [Oceanicaulis sp.]